jgi:hypothetical protein
LSITPAGLRPVPAHAAIRINPVSSSVVLKNLCHVFIFFPLELQIQTMGTTRVAPTRAIAPNFYDNYGLAGDCRAPEIVPFLINHTSQCCQVLGCPQMQNSENGKVSLYQRNFSAIALLPLPI